MITDNENAANKIKIRLEGVMGIPFTVGNQVTALRNGDEIFPAMLEAITSAKHSIDLATYVYWTGHIAQKFADTLSKQARAGLKVRLLLDSFGAKKMDPAVLNQMKDAGVNIRWFRPLLAMRFFMLDNRTHRKILITDDTLGFTGGVGIAKEWEGDAQNDTEWRDTHFRLQGPAVAGLNAAFIANWAETGDSTIAHEDYQIDHDQPGESQIQVIRSTASGGWSDIVTLFHALISAATRSIKISTAYFVCEQPIIDVLLEARKRGVEIEILIPGSQTDQEVSRVAGQGRFTELLEAGITLYQYNKTMLHAKIILIDDVLSCIGSPNFNQRSMGKDEEIALCIIDRDLNETLTKHFAEDMRSAGSYDLQSWKDRGAWQRFKEWVMAPFRKQL